MLCPICLGQHVVSTNRGIEPCPECGGLGEIHCCDGLQEQDGRAEMPTACRFSPPTHDVRVVNSAP